MTKIATLLITIFTTIFFIGGTTSLYAQQAPASKQNVKETKVINHQPYYLYKGISDLDLAKKEWIKDHPAEYKKMTNHGPAKPATAATMNIADPNKGKGLPAHYDDSKTNTKSKN